ncbi:Imm50 family immunity protein [Hydrogenophaga sp.]|uniref:Imm50 family immunity protein n=1 Tax=Hydrogenophaga sp. TaxID=1904254 RepID=UPI0027246A01|nr:Imm50 family immunity protein [Hydrogenophaga sp.]MDO9433982.1 Imm50 family immunity protein [Hydrogenophaga sp.]
MNKQSTAAYEFIEGHELVLSRFGMWPSFHDGEVHRIVLDRLPKRNSALALPTLELWLRGWTMELSEGRYVLVNDSVVHFLFEGVTEVELEGFNQQNVLTALNLSTDADSLSVELEHCYQFCGRFRARKATVVGVEAFNAADN